MSLRLRTVFLFIALLIVGASVWFTNTFARYMAEEEHKKMELWAEATRLFITADEDTDIDFVSSIIEDNTTIPVYIVDAEGKFLFSRNVREPKQNIGEFYQERIATLQASQEPIEVRISDDIVQYIYYDESTLLRRLHYFPYVQFSVIFLFVLIAIYSLYTAQQSEQNRVWVGLTKETAHQLGTPISSLTAWIQLLQDKYPDDTLIPEMDKDMQRLRMVAERFSKVGSEPELTDTEIMPLLTEAVDYMRTRTSQKITYELLYNKQPLSANSPSSISIKVAMNRPLFEWVIENLCKNAIDAMSASTHTDKHEVAKGSIVVNVEATEAKVLIDITDTGKGIERSKLHRVFTPGYTTKQRGWGLGLSLAKRIVEQYHKGRIFVKQSVVGEGTTFRIILNRTA